MRKYRVMHGRVILSKHWTKIGAEFQAAGRRAARRKLELDPTSIKVERTNGTTNGFVFKKRGST